MSNNELINQAIKVWCDYGKAINEAFGFKDFYIEEGPLKEATKDADPKKLEKFIETIRHQIHVLKNAD